MVDGRHTSPAEWSEADIRPVCAAVPASAPMAWCSSVSARLKRRAHDLLQLGRVPRRDVRQRRAVQHAPGDTARASPAQGMVLETDAGSYETRSSGPGSAPSCDSPPWRRRPRCRASARPTGERRVALGIVGVPHLVVLVDDVSCVDVAPRGGRCAPIRPSTRRRQRELRLSGNSRSEWSMRTYERGVEAETLACGTGAVAAACAVVEWAWPSFQ